MQSKDFFKNKKCIITGAASGIGKSVAIQLGEYGAQLFLTDIQKEALESVVKKIKSKGGHVAKAKNFDITNFEEVQNFANEIHAQHGAMDIIMNIAGIAIWGAVDKMKHSEWKKVIDVNLMGPIHIIETFLPQIIQQRNGGHLVNVASAAALFGLPMHGAYCASKFGLRGLSDVLRHDLKKHRIKVHLVCPGAVDTGLVQTLQISGIDTETAHFSTLKKQFQQHAVSPDKVATAILNGITNNDYLVFTSPDIKFGYWGQRKFTYFYNLAMQAMNDYFQKVIKQK